MTLFRSLLAWLGHTPPITRVGLRPHRAVDLDLPFDDAYERVMHGIDVVLGANVRSADRARGEIEADFGLIGSERMRATLQRLDGGRTRVDIEAIYAANAAPPQRSSIVEALAEWLVS
jgi:hypothetical protein